jgi:hypothetical protein
MPNAARRRATTAEAPKSAVLKRSLAIVWSMDLVHRPHVRHRKVRVDGADHGGYTLLESGGFSGGAQGDRGAWPGTLEEWDVDLRESVHVLGAGVSP